jgi:UDP-glucuronate 4-epimerase
MNILVTGCCGFIGFNLTKRLLEDGHDVVGIDNLNDYYNVELKLRNKGELETFSGFRIYVYDICDFKLIESIFSENEFDCVINLAAQAGVSGSLINPFNYINTNICGFVNILECCKRYGIKKLIYASSSSVYGNSDIFPLTEECNTDRPISLYAATKKSDEVLAESYSNMFGLCCVGLRFFTVYGECGRPDMAPAIFAKSIMEGAPIVIYNDGDLKRDFTYVGDVVEAIVQIIRMNVNKKHEIYNIGSSRPVYVMELVREIEKNIGKKGEIIFKPGRVGDVKYTYCNCNKLKKDYNYIPRVGLSDGVKYFIEWFNNNKRYY